MTMYEYDKDVKWFFVALIFVIMFSLLAYKANAIAIAHFDFDNSDDPQEDKINNYEGDVVDATFDENNGYFNGGFNFTGDPDEIVIETLPYNNQSGSVCLWEYHTSLDSDRYSFSHYQDGSRIYIYRLGDDYKYQLGDASCTISQADSISLKTWTHRCITWNSTNFTGYVDNSLIGECGYTDMKGFTTSYVGSRLSASGDDFHNGTIDEVWIFNHTLTEEEIHNLYYVNSITCSPDWSYTSWANVSFDENKINQTRTRYDENNCYGSTNSTEEKYLLYNWEEVQALNDMREVFDMGFILLATVVLWLGLWIFGYHAIQTYNTLLGGTMIVLTTPINIFFSYAFREALNQGTGFMGIAFTVMTAWTFGIFILIYRKTNRKTVVQG